MHPRGAAGTVDEQTGNGRPALAIDPLHLLDVRTGGQVNTLVLQALVT
ncbi:MAG: hypothetical protein ABI323_09035 [Solirubrobacteraceae bacterium]